MKTNTFENEVAAVTTACRQFPMGHAGRTQQVTAYCTKKGIKFLVDITPETPIEEIREAARKAVAAGY